MDQFPASATIRVVLEIPGEELSKLLSTKPAKDRSGYLRRFLEQVEPHGKLDPEERQFRAEQARAECMSRLGKTSAAVRRARKAVAA